MLFSSLLLAKASLPAALSRGVLFPAVLLIILFLIILLVILLVIPFHLHLNFSKQGPLIQGGYRIAWLGLTLRKREVLPQPASDLLASILKKEANVGEDEGDGEIKERNAREEKGKLEKGKADKVKGDEGKTDEEKADDGREIENSIDEQKSDIKRSITSNSILDAAPAIAILFIDLFKSIVFQKLSCRFSFGLNDPAETAVMSGYLWSVASTLGLFRANVSIEPYFEGERLEGEFVAELKTRLIWIAKAVIDALRKKEIRSLIRVVAGWD